MSTEYETQGFVGYKFSHKNFCEMVENKFPELYKELNFEEEKDYHAMIAESFAENLGLDSLYLEDEESHVIGKQLTNYITAQEAMKQLNELSELVQSILKQGESALIIFENLVY